MSNGLNTIKQTFSYSSLIGLKLIQVAWLELTQFQKLNLLRCLPLYKIIFYVYSPVQSSYLELKLVFLHIFKWKNIEILYVVQQKH